MWYRKGTTKHYLSLAFGFVEVLPDKVTVLAQIAERAEDIDVPRAEAARQRAEARLAEAAGRPRLRAGEHRAVEGDEPSQGRARTPAPPVINSPWFAVDCRHACAVGREFASGHPAPDQRGQLLHPPGPRPLRRGRRHGRPRRRRNRLAHRRPGDRELSSPRPWTPISTSTWPQAFDVALGVDGNRLKGAFHIANQRLAKEVAGSQDLRGMATTASALIVNGVDRGARARRRLANLPVA